MNKKKVLIVDDEMDMRIFLSTLFETSGREVATAREGKEGIEKAGETAFDLIVLDVMMPGEGGVMMYRRLKTDQELKKIPVIILSAIAKKTFMHYLKMLNAQMTTPIPEPDVYMEKPPEAEELLDISRKLLGDEKRDGPESSPE